MDNNENRQFQDYSDPGMTNLNGQLYQNGQPYQNGDPYQNMGNYSQNNYGGDNYNYGYNSYSRNSYNVPLDYKGRPLKNRFGMKLTFSIIEMVIALLGMIGGSVYFGVIPLVLSILACVFVCLQNRDFHNADWESFQSKSKTASVFLWITFGIYMIWLVLVIILVILVLVIGVSTFTSVLDDLGMKNMEPDYKYEYEYKDDEDSVYDADDSDKKEADDKAEQHKSNAKVNNLEGGYVDMVKGYETFTLEGADITLPMSLDAFLDAGFYMNEEDLEETLEGNNSYGYSYYSSRNDQYLGTIFIYNVTNRDIKVKNGIVGGMTINRGYGDEEADLTLLGGLKFGSSVDDAIQVFGSDVTNEDIDGDYSYYSWQFTYGYATSIELDYEKDQLKEVWIMNYASLSDY